MKVFYFEVDGKIINWRLGKSWNKEWAARGTRIFMNFYFIYLRFLQFGFFTAEICDLRFEMACQLPHNLFSFFEDYKFPQFPFCLFSIFCGMREDDGR